MKQLPPNVIAYKKTKIFTEEIIPDGLLKNHQTLPEVWGKIVILKGRLEYVIQSEPIEIVSLDDKKFGVVEPQILHHVRALGPVEFYVEFFK
ncbi:MAG: DUF1971 domain-containing protein [Bacteriovorax sp.]|jgi:tellurite resistance-related uncharacterized protein